MTGGSVTKVLTLDASNNATFAGEAQITGLLYAKSRLSVNSSAFSNSNCYITMEATGSDDYNANSTHVYLRGYDAVNNFSGIGWNWKDSNDHPPAVWTGVKCLDYGSYTKAEYIIATRDNTGNNNPTRRLTIGADGNATFAGKVKINGASDADPTLSLKAHTNGWDGGMTMESNDGTFTIQIHPENGTTYGLMFDQKLYVVGDVSATSFTDRTPYPETLKIAYDVLASHKRLDDYDKNDKEKQLDHSKLHEYAKAEHGRDVSAVISCLVETVNDLTAKVEALENA